MNKLSQLVEEGIGRFDEIRLRRLLFILAQTDPVLVEMLAKGRVTDDHLQQAGIPLDELQGRLHQLVEIAEKLDHRNNERLNDGGPGYELPQLAVVDTTDFLMSAEDMGDEISRLQRSQLPAS